MTVAYWINLARVHNYWAEHYDSEFAATGSEAVGARADRHHRFAAACGSIGGAIAFGYRECL